MTAFKSPRRMTVIIPAIKTGQIWREVDPRQERRVVIVDDMDGEGSVVTIATIQADGSRSSWVRQAQRRRFNGKRGGYALVSEP